MPATVAETSPVQRTDDQWCHRGRHGAGRIRNPGQRCSALSGWPD